ncbi:hypothetical protein [Clostridium botulinum]|nr:hypothetical protein [Clostridium botulinum]
MEHNIKPVITTILVIGIFIYFAERIGYINALIIYMSVVLLITYLKK